MIGGNGRNVENGDLGIFSENFQQNPQNRIQRRDVTSIPFHSNSTQIMNWNGKVPNNLLHLTQPDTQNHVTGGGVAVFAVGRPLHWLVGDWLVRHFPC